NHDSRTWFWSAIQGQSLSERIGADRFSPGTPTGKAAVVDLEILGARVHWIDQVVIDGKVATRPPGTFISNCKRCIARREPAAKGPRRHELCAVRAVTRRHDIDSFCDVRSAPTEFHRTPGMWLTGNRLHSARQFRYRLLEPECRQSSL